MEKEQREIRTFLFMPLTGNVLAVISGLSFYLLCMMLSLVGPAGSSVEHADRNRYAFAAVLLVTLLLSALAVVSKLGCRSRRGGALPWFSLGLCVVCILSFIVLFAGGFAL